MAPPELFTIVCATCQRRLKVRSLAAVGQILRCPKCDSMVEVTPPDGWCPPAESDPTGPAEEPDPADEHSPVGTGSEMERLGRRAAHWAAMAGLATTLVGGIAAFALVRRGPPTRTEPRAVAASTPSEPATPTGSATDPPQEISSDSPPAEPPSLPSTSNRPADRPAPRSAAARDRSGLVADDPTPAAPPPDGHPVPRTPRPETPVDEDARQAIDTRRPEAAAIAPTRTDRPAADSPVARMENDPTDPEPTTEPLSTTADVRARLDDVVHQIDFRRVPLIDWVHFLVRMTRIPISLDADSLAAAGRRPTDPISVHARNATVDSILTESLASVGLTREILDGQLILRAPERPRQTVIYRINDLLETTPQDTARRAADRFADRLTELVMPGSWTGQGGDGRVTVGAEEIVVEQTPRAHRKILLFCERLRLARQIPLRSKKRDPRMSLQSRRDSGREELRQRVTFTFMEPTGLIQLSEELGRVTGLTLLIDWQTLGPYGVTPDSTLTGSAVDQPLSEALSAALAPHDLAWRALDATTLQILGRSAAERRLELEFYPIADRPASPAAESQLLANLRRSVGDDLWVEAGGRGVLLFDAPSGHVIVLQSQDVQSRLEGLLRK